MFVSQEQGKGVVLFNGKPMRGGEDCSRFASFWGFNNESVL